MHHNPETIKFSHFSVISIFMLFFTYFVCASRKILYKVKKYRTDYYYSDFFAIKGNGWCFTYLPANSETFS
jgi:hypothetical protein